MSAPDPTTNYRGLAVPPVSTKVFTIAGILVTVHGLNELPDGCQRVSCLWLLHPRLQTHECMAPLAATVIGAWNKHLAKSSDRSLGLLAVSFDQRNHGSRLSTPMANEAWRDGNATHAQDMFSGFTGTVRDMGQLIEYLPGYVFPPPSPRRITTHSVLGISLGGHSAWHALLHIPVVTTVVSVIGCPDYAGLMADRARKSKLASFVRTESPGSDFFRSGDFPDSLTEAVLRSDPRGLLVGRLPAPQSPASTIETSQAEQKRALEIMRKTLSGKRLQCLSGAIDKLVPYAAGAPFMEWMKAAVSKGGWAADVDLEVDDLVFDGVGHDMSLSMVKEATRFILQSLEHEASKVSQNKSRI